jgi:chromosome segregation ATPase
VAAPGGQPDLNRELADARRNLLEAEQELREANAALARASHGSEAGGAELERLSERQVEAQAAFDSARSRLPELMVRARAAGMSAAALRAYQHSLYGN